MFAPHWCRRVVPATFTVVALMLACGCGGGGRSGVPAKGKVTFNGDIVDKGAIIFVPKDETLRLTQTVGGEISNGTYEIKPEKGLVPGEYQVQITWQKKTGREIEVDPPNKIDERIEVIPEKFNTKTELTYTVTSGENNKDFTLEGPEAPPPGSGP